MHTQYNIVTYRRSDPGNNGVKDNLQEANMAEGYIELSKQEMLQVCTEELLVVYHGYQSCLHE